MNSFFVCSIYKNGDDTTKYFAILGNFSKINTDAIKLDTVHHETIPTQKVKNSLNGLIYDTVGNARETLYAKLISDGFTTGTLGKEYDFVRNVQDSTKANKLYVALINSGYTTQSIGSNSQFVYYMTLR